MNKNPTSMEDLRQAADFAEKSIDNVDDTTLSTILDEVKQCKDVVKVANSKHYQVNNLCSQSHAHINVAKKQFRPHNSSYKQHGTD